MVNISTPPGLEGLFDLDRQGVDIRPTLLRVITDQYLRIPAHSPEEEAQYTALALRLIDEADITTRAAIASRLAPHASAPRAIILRLARDTIEVAEPVLLHSPCLTPADCDAIGRERGAAYAHALASRSKPSTRAQPPVARGAEVPVSKTDPQNPQPSATTSVTAVPDADANELSELFFAAGSPERRLILLNLDFVTWPAEPPRTPLQRADIWRMETAALRHNTSTVMRELERALGITYQQSRRIVEDDLGEPIVVAAKAMTLPADVLQRILLFMNPRVGQSVDRVYELANLYNEISIEAARRLVAILRAAEPAGRKWPTDTRAFYAAAEAAHRALSEVARSPARTKPTIKRAVGGGER